MTTGSVPAQAPDYIRSDDGATMREVYPGEFVNLAVLQVWGFRSPTATAAATKLTLKNSTLDRL